MSDEKKAHNNQAREQQIEELEREVVVMECWWVGLALPKQRKPLTVFVC